MGKLTIWLSLMLVVFGLTSSNALEDIGSRFARTTKKILRKSEQACVEYGAGFQRKVFPSKYVLPGEYQHNVALGYEKDSGEKEIVWLGCNGVLISEYYVLTAAHCIVSPSKMLPVMVRLGSIDITGKEDEALPQDIEIERTIVHPSYNPIKKVADIALLQLKEPAKFDRYVQPACLYTKSDVPDSMISTGRGRLELRSSAFSDMLLKANIRTVDYDACNKFYAPRFNISDSHICGTQAETDICHIGSGGSLFVPNNADSRATVVGIVSFGRGCGNVSPEVFTKIYSYLDWIENIVWPDKESNEDTSIWTS